MSDSIEQVREVTSEEEKFEDLLDKVGKALEYKADFFDVSVSEETVRLVQDSIAGSILECAGSDGVEGDVDYWVDQVWGDFGDHKSTSAQSNISFSMGGLSEESEEIKEIVMKDLAYERDL